MVSAITALMIINVLFAILKEVHSVTVLFRSKLAQSRF